jgi:hypothetical protein
MVPSILTAPFRERGDDGAGEGKARWVEGHLPRLLLVSYSCAEAPVGDSACPERRIEVGVSLVSAGPRAQGPALSLLLSRALTQGDEKVVQLIERLDHCIG